MKKLSLIHLLIVAAVACVTPGYNGAYTEITAYVVSPTGKTPKGVSYDDPKHEVDPARWDILVDTVEARLAALPPRWTDAEVAQMGCVSYPVPRKIERSWFAFKVAPDWHPFVCDPGRSGPTARQVFPCAVNPVLCKAKPEIANCSAPCECRATVQGKFIVTAPNLELAPGELARLVTGCNNTWVGPLVTVSAPIFALVLPSI